MEVQLQAEQSQTRPEEGQTQNYTWITEEALLRDEGVVFGMQGADPESKTDAIRSFHERDKAPIKKEIETLHQNIRETTIELEDIRLRAEALKQASERRPPIPAADFDPGLLFQFLAYVSICSLNYALLRYWCFPVFQSDLIILGIYLLGLFSVFSGKAAIYRKDGAQPEEEGKPGRENWKIYAEEYVIPICLSGFVVIMSWPLFKPYQSAFFFIVLTLLFTFSGKGLVFLLFLFRDKLSRFFRHRRERIADRKKTEWNAIESARLEQMRSDLTTRQLELRQRLDDAAGRLSSLEALEQYRLNLFQSEYDMALSAYGKNHIPHGKYQSIGTH